VLTAQPNSAAKLTQRHAHIALALLFGVSLFNFLDRFMVSILIPAIKVDLTLTDTQIGFLQGPGFAVLYAICGIPIARMADSYSRSMIVSVALATWSAMTAACGFAQNFFQLAIARILVGIGEAGATPPSQSLIADYYAPGSRATALVILNITTPLGVMFGFLIGGWVTQNFGWRPALFAVAAPGLVYALIVWLVLKEPPRGSADGVADVGAAPPFWSGWAQLFKRKTFFHMCWGGGAFSFMFLSVIQWAPSFYSRSHALTISEIGTWLAFVVGIPMSLGLLTGGVIADRLGQQDARRPLWVASSAILISAPLYLLVFTVDDYRIAFLAMCFPLFLGVLQGGSLYSGIIGVAGIRMRSVAAATLVLFFNLVGGLGPQIVGILSDLLTPSLGDEALRYSLLWIAVGAAFWTSFHFAMASRTVREDLAAATADVTRTKNL